jgi:LPXTG-site transpeptidase (sortase) family protein
VRGWLCGLAATACLLVTPVSTATAQEAQPTLPAWSVPYYVSIPRLGSGAWIVPLGLEDDGAMASPTDPDTVGWYILGPGVGYPGNAVLAGHVDWAGRLRAFGLLKQLSPGDRIEITDGEGSVLTYTVVWNYMFDAQTAPVEDIFRQTEQEELTLITCGGTFDHAAHQYVSRTVVRAVREPTQTMAATN